LRAASALGLTTEVPSAETAQTTDGLMSVSTVPDGSEVTVLVPTDQAEPVIALTAAARAWVSDSPGQLVQSQPGSSVTPRSSPTSGRVATTVQPLASGAIRTSVTIAGPGSPNQFRFPVSLDSGSSLQLRDDGSVTVSSEVSYLDETGDATTRTLVTSTIAPAWAVDADGKAVPTRYSLEGDTLVQHVDLTATTAFPVVADPFWSTRWQRGQVRLAIAVAVATLMIPVSKVLKLKAFVSRRRRGPHAAKLLVGATSRAEKARVIQRRHRYRRG
jgi:hypothetical protein